MKQEWKAGRVADWVVRRIADEGVRHVFLLPGGGAMHLNDAITLEPRVNGVICQHEQACGIAAEAYGRTGNPSSPGFGVAIVTSGPGATNIITPVVGAWIDSIPILVISGQAKRADLVGGRDIRQGGVQEVDIVKMVTSVTKYAVTVMDPLHIETHIETALKLMRSGRPGPVWIDIPLDVQAAPFHPSRLEDKKHDLDTFNLVSNPLTPESSVFIDVEQVLHMLSEAQRPLLLVGHGVRLSGASGDLAKLIEFLGIPTVLTWNALDLLPFEHPLNIGRPGVVATRSANFAVQNCDFLLAIGARLDNVITGYNLNGFARAARKVIIDIDKAELINKSSLPGAKFVHSDARLFINSLMEKARYLKIEEWRKTCYHWKAKYSINEDFPVPSVGRISHAQFVSTLSEVAPPNCIITTGSSGLAIEFFYAGFRNKPGQRTFLTSGLGSMGYGLPAAIGACLGNASLPLIALESDGSLQLNVQELATLAELALPICLIVMNNEGYSSIKNTQRNYFSARYIGTDPASGLKLPSLKKLSELYDINYVEINKVELLDEGLREALARKRPTLVNVVLIPDEPLQPKCSAILQQDGSILSMPLEDMSPLLSLSELQAEMIVDLTEASLSVERSIGQS
jgi:acetolactate synthase-1/2/3 large subunit